eukprot:GSMAST32.ASY1.ANO1.2538.1 assembled CDS
MMKSASQSLKFFDSSRGFNQRELNLLLMTIQKNECEERKRFYTNIRRCRRRIQRSIEQTSLSFVFNTPDEYSVIDYRSYMTHIRWKIHEKGLYAFDAFRAFDTDHNSVLSCSELFSGILWLGIEISQEQLYNIVIQMDLNRDGLISLAEFNKALYRFDDSLTIAEEEVSKARRKSDNPRDFVDSIIIPSKLIPELSDQYSTMKKKKSKPLDPALLNDIECKLKKHKKFKLVWTSQGTSSRRKGTCWTPDLTAINKINALHRPKQAICLGHYAGQMDSFLKPSTKPFPPLLFQIKDVGVGLAATGGYENIERFKETFCPVPIRYHLVWHKGTKGKNSIYCWSPVPPSAAFVALGMVCTTTDDVPTGDIMRCVPRQWVEKSSIKPRCIWDDSGTAGRRGSFWVANKLGTLFVSEGHQVPRGPFWDFKKTELDHNGHQHFRASMYESPVGTVRG